jgi:hypothetical protein
LSPEEIRERIDSLRSREGGLQVEATARILDGWSDPNSSWRAELERELPTATGFSPQMVREGLRLALAGWTGQALRELVQHECPNEQRGVSGLLLAGSIPMPSILGLLAPLVVGSSVVAKSASRDPVTPRLVARSVRETDAELGARIEVLEFPGHDRERVAALCDADWVVATGSDETVAQIHARRVVRHGHRLSVAVLGPEACRPVSDTLADALALDVALWDQLGCLSPVAIYAPQPDEVAEALAAALERAESLLPRGSVDARAAALATQERDGAELRAADGQSVRLLAGPTFTVVRESDATPRPSPLHRFVRVPPVDDASGLLAALSPLASRLAGVALAGFGRDTRAVASRLAGLGASRICPPGRLQAPPLSWPRGGLGVLSSAPVPASLEVA